MNTHGTSTPVGDVAETGAIKEVFGNSIPPFSSSKSLCGHSLGASGVQETIYCILMMQNNFIQASANVDTVDEKVNGMPLVTERVDNAELNTVMTNNFGFGGTNASLVLSKFKD
ncbi:3-oxoacyl-[acyl-carrier-protein] synthase, KASI [hydrothermal vent metagenome]|uniref:3-oxoacyl-[acyl-carrier-protein] synthase, KASI n=1 Tax=hydrothermal vent metagenome TaxID=652676 RepID=A0A3B0X0Q3_9ZZZZ